MNTKKTLVTALTSVIALMSLAVPLSAAQLTDENKEFLASYSKVHLALASDDLAAAKKAAADLGSSGAEMANSASIFAARNAFKKVSAEAEQKAAGQPGFYLMHCPMKGADWVQTSDKVENPYGGKEMLTCGELKK